MNATTATNVGGGITCGFGALGVNNVLFANLTSSEYHTSYDYGNDKVIFYYSLTTATAAYSALASDVAVTGVNGYFCVIGT